jgi:hypothetical protein
MTRNAGITSRQISEAPKGALFIWPEHRTMHYAVALATHLKREDVEIASPNVFEGAGQRLRGRALPAIILDHATRLTDRQHAVYREFQRLIEIRQSAGDA